ncbi:unnamed protein product [Caenorhabditis sp. 36 PRJEB53466]|nr:unnamed protein product [Caenorhabditis sp. 36 PRJEB53466]
MRKQNRPNQTARKQMQNLTVELFARDEKVRRQLLDDALAVSPTQNSPTVVSPTTSSTEPPPPVLEPIPELVQILLAPETHSVVRKPKPFVKKHKKEAPAPPPPSAEDKPTVHSPIPPKEIRAEKDNLPEHPSTPPATSESQRESVESMSPEEALTCAQIIAEEERREVEAQQEVAQEEIAPDVPTPTPTPVLVPEEEEYVTPPPLQRVPQEAQPRHLASIRAVTESMNIAAHPTSQNQEPMSFAACVRKMPSIESMSLAPSPYARFDGKSNPFNNGPNGGFGEKDGKTNPFANRKRFDFDSPSNTSSRSLDRPSLDRDFSSDGFSSMSSTSKINRTVIPRSTDSSGTMPTYWKNRSFSSASSYYPQSQRSSSAQFSPSKSSMTTLNIPTHGHMEDLDGYLVSSSSQSSAFGSKRTDLTMKKERWARMKAKKRLLRRPIEDEYYEDPDEEEEILRGKGVMLNQIVQQNPSGHYEDADLLRKYRRDVAFVKEKVMTAIDGNIEGIRDLRFILGSVQTYGNIDGECMMAELALNEFSLFSGILEKFHSVVGPWTPENESQRRRASRHAFETHRIPLQHTITTVSKRKLIEEILGRVEPSIACLQGVRVGLYGDQCDEKSRVDLNIKNGFKDPGMLCDKDDRRFILVPQSELELMVESMKHLAANVGLQYEGFPTHQNRYVIVEAFVEAIAEIMGEKIDVETMRWFSLLGQKVEAAESVSPWETGTDFHCARHSEPKSNFCAAVTVGRTCCIIYHVLGGFFRRYHLKKIPTAHLGPSNSNASPAFHHRTYY